MNSARSLIEMGIQEMGSIQALADALSVDRTTVGRWRDGRSDLPGPARVALLAILSHPDEYSQVKKT